MQRRRESGLDYFDATGDPYEIHPLRPGLFPWAADSNGNVLCWLTEGEAEDWPVILASRNDDVTGKYEMAMTTFLAKAFQGEIQEPVQYETVSEEDRIFVQRP